MRFLHNADQVVGTRSKKNFFSRVSTMCLQLGSGTNQLDGVNKMVLIRQTSEFGHVLLRSLAFCAYFSRYAPVDYFPLKALFW